MKLKIIETSQCPAGTHPGNESRTSHTKHRLASPPPTTAAIAVFTQQVICVIQHGPSYIKLFHEHTNTHYCLKTMFHDSHTALCNACCHQEDDSYYSISQIYHCGRRFCWRTKRFIGDVNVKWQKAIEIVQWQKQSRREKPGKQTTYRDSY